MLLVAAPILILLYPIFLLLAPIATYRLIRDYYRSHNPPKQITEPRKPKCNKCDKQPYRIFIGDGDDYDDRYMLCLDHLLEHTENSYNELEKELEEYKKEKLIEQLAGLPPEG